MRPHGRLSALQEQILDALFPGTTGFVLTGGAALAGFYLKHRETKDLDLFTVDRDAFHVVVSSLPALASQHGLSVSIQLEAPAFHRALMGRYDDGVVVDLVLDLSPQLGEAPVLIDGIPLDPLQQIFVNKITTLVGRQEERDVVDLLHLERQGLRVEDHLEHARAKDGGCTPATLAWLLDPWADQLPDESMFAGQVPGGELKDYMRALAVRMRRVAFPSTS